MGQHITSLSELKDAVLNHDEMLIELFLQKMIDEGLIDMNMITNPNLKSKDGRILIDIDKKREDYIKVPCLFHDTDNDGSGRLNLDGQYFKCFNGSCVANKPMNAIDLYMVLKLGVDPKLLSTDEVNKNEFPKAVREMADMFGIPYSFGGRKLTEEEKEAATIQQIREEFAELYHDAIFKHRYAKKAVEYMLKERGFAYGVVPFKALVKRFKIGFAPGWRFGYDQMKHKYSDDILIKSGVVRRVQNKNSGGQEIRDFLSGGVVLPYFSKGKINNLYARSLFAKDKNFRHLRLKGNVDIPINFDEAKKHSELIIVEGELSWLSLIALGYDNTIGNRGTNGLSDEHVAAIKSIRDKTEGDKCSKIFLCFDPDDAGQGAIAKTGKKLLDEGFDVRVICLENGDPNDFLQLYKKDAKPVFEKMRKNAISYEAFMITYLLKKEKLTTESTDADVLAAFKKIEPFVEKTPKLQLALIASQVVKLLNSEVITLDLLKFAWLGVQLPAPVLEEKVNVQKLENIGFQQALKYFWVFATDSKERFDVLNKTGSFSNLVLVRDVSSFIEGLKQHNHINSLLFDAEMDDETLQLLFNELQGFQFRRFDCPNNESILNASKEELQQMVKSVEHTSSKAV